MDDVDIISPPLPPHIHDYQLYKQGWPLVDDYCRDYSVFTCFVVSGIFMGGGGSQYTLMERLHSIWLGTQVASSSQFCGYFFSFRCFMMSIFIPQYLVMEAVYSTSSWTQMPTAGRQSCRDCSLFFFKSPHDFCMHNNNHGWRWSPVTLSSWRQSFPVIVDAGAPQLTILSELFIISFHS